MLELYDALLARRSVRRYAGKEVPPQLIDQLLAFSAQIEPLVPSAAFGYSILPVKDNELTSVAGGYGRILSCPLVAVPHITDGPHALVDFGFRTEQLVIEVTRLGLGSCWVGALMHEAAAAAHFGVPQGARIGAVIALGYPETGLLGRAANNIIRSVAGAGRRLTLDQFLLGDVLPSSFQEKVLEALLAAPSTGNARPWRIALRDEQLFFSVSTKSPYYRFSGNVGYHLIDAGIGMANISLALAALGRPAKWTLLDRTEELDPIAAIPFPA